jgi:hypothetical protein
MTKNYFSLLFFFSIAYLSAQEFVSTWKTDNPGASEDNQIIIPTFPGETYDFTVTWGDGNSDTNVSGTITHTYAVPGTYQVTISGINRISKGWIVKYPIYPLAFSILLSTTA